MLRGLLLTGGRPRYLRHELTGVGQDETVSPEPLWWPPAKIVGRYLGPFLASFEGFESPPEPPQPSGAVTVDVDLSAAEVDRLALPLEVIESEGETVGEVMAKDPLVVAPEDTLGEVTEKMRVRDNRLGRGRRLRTLDRDLDLPRLAASLRCARAPERGARARMDDCRTRCRACVS